MDDPGSTIFSIILYLFFILGCAYFAGAEISLASVNRVHLMSFADNGDKRAKRVLKLLDNFDEALSALLIGNNIFNIGCTTFSVVVATQIWGNGSTTVSIATVVTTIIMFVFAEMLPKCFAKSCNERFAMSVSGSLVVIMKLLKPLSFLFTSISRLASKPFSKRVTPEVTVTENELQDIVESIGESDDIDQDTGELVKSALKFSDLTTADILVPWELVQTIKAGTKNADIFEIIKDTKHSRIPVLTRDGKVRGILQIRRFLRAYYNNKRLVLASVMDYPYFVKPDTPIDELLAQMSNHKRNLAVVKDADDVLLGIVTVEDIMEELVGEIYDEDDIGGDSDE